MGSLPVCKVVTPKEVFLPAFPVVVHIANPGDKGLRCTGIFCQDNLLVSNFYTFHNVISLVDAGRLVVDEPVDLVIVLLGFQFGDTQVVFTNLRPFLYLAEGKERAVFIPDRGKKPPGLQKHPVYSGPALVISICVFFTF